MSCAGCSRAPRVAGRHRSTEALVGPEDTLRAEL